MKELPKKYNHKDTEAKWHKAWLEDKTYAWDQTQPRDNTFVIDTPPPTVSGILHMGHIFSYTQADFVARYQRMSGKTVFYPMGFDDNGLPTERLVEKVKKIRGGNMPREEFIEICHSVVDEAEEEFRRLFRSIALSVDWDQEYQTISPHTRKISQLSFVHLWEHNHVDRHLEPTLWDPMDRTALAQADVEDKELPSTMNDLVFTLEDGKEVMIATTRPELLAACVAVFYHPDDARYQQYKGKHAITPIFGVKVPILADEQVDQEKGTGLVMCCTFGDQTDIHWWKTHKLPTRVIIGHDGKLGSLDTLGQGEDWPSEDLAKAQAAIAEITGLKIAAAREKMLELLSAAGVLKKQEEIVHAVKCAERSGHPLEILVTPQWFVKILDQKELLLKKAAECNWYPSHMKIRMDQWIEGLSWDWCISRQRYFGVPFPVWYSKRAGEEGKILVAHPDDLPVDPLVDLPRGYSKEEVEAEKDVMDTWATSSVTPQISSHGIAEGFGVNEERHKQLFPADLRPQAHEIIRSWAFYTLVKAHLHEDSVPWKNLMISGWCLAPDKTKMSKSKGNVITPVDLIEDKGADAVRYWASTSRLGSDTAYSEDVLKIGKKLVTKLWNAAKFAAIHLQHIDEAPTTAKDDISAGRITETLDKWAISRLHAAIAKATEEFERFEYCNARVAVEDFFWNVFCDNYLEMVKVRAYGEAEGTTKEGQRSVAYTIYHCLEAVLKLFGPFIPHITEELYSHIFDDQFEQSIHKSGTWPQAEDFVADTNADRSGEAGVEILNAVRKLKADKNVSLKYPLDYVHVTAADEGGQERDIQPIIQDLCYVTNADAIDWKPSLGEEAEITERGQFKIEASFKAEAEVA